MSDTPGPWTSGTANLSEVESHQAQQECMIHEHWHASMHGSNTCKGKICSTACQWAPSMLQTERLLSQRVPFHPQWWCNNCHPYSQKIPTLPWLQDVGVTTPVTKSNNWVSSVAYSWKSNREHHVCLDQEDLNLATIFSHCWTPMFKEIMHDLARSSVFTKLDATLAYYSIRLDHASSLLRTFNALCSQFRFPWLQFRLFCLLDVFQFQVDQMM